VNLNGPDSPTRAINIGAGTAEVLKVCARKATPVSAIEPLPDGGTHVVLVTLADADTIRRPFRGKLLARNTRRTPFRGGRAF